MKFCLKNENEASHLKSMQVIQQLLSLCIERLVWNCWHSQGNGHPVLQLDTVQHFSPGRWGGINQEVGTFWLVIKEIIFSLWVIITWRGPVRLWGPCPWTSSQLKWTTAEAITPSASGQTGWPPKVFSNWNYLVISRTKYHRCLQCPSSWTHTLAEKYKGKNTSLVLRWSCSSQPAKIQAKWTQALGLALPNRAILMESTLPVLELS